MTEKVVIETGMLSDAQCRDVLNWLVDYVDDEIDSTGKLLKEVNGYTRSLKREVVRNTHVGKRLMLTKLRDELHDKVNDTVYGTEEDRDNFYE